MFGILVYLYFLFIGYAYSCYVFKEKDVYFRGWMGGIFAHAVLMMGIVVPSIFCGFTYLSHIILTALSALVLLYLIKKSGWGRFRALLCSVTGESTEGLPKEKAKKKGNVSAAGESCMDWKILVFLILPITLIIAALMTNHILAPYSGGGYASGQSTYGDLQMHLGFITSIAEQGAFPPNYVFLSGYKMNYPFFVDMLSSSLYLFGTPLRWAVLIPSYVMSFLLVGGLYFLAYKVTNRKGAAVLATVFFFFCGCFGFSYFFEGAKADSTAFTRIFTEYYQTPTNLNDSNIRWSNTICDMIIPQRTTMAGWLMFMPALWLLLDAVKSKSRKMYITLGLLAGCMPMIHTHSFLGLGMICAVMFFMYLIGEKNKKEYVINWVIFGGIVAVMAAPQLFYWTFRQTSGNESFLNFQFNWVNHNDPYLWFYLKNWGITALFAAPAVWKASRDNKKLLAGCLFIFAAAEFVLFQPNEYDNNKLFYIVYMILLMVVCDWFMYMWDALKNVKGRAYLGAAVVTAGTLSGALTIIREFRSGAQYRIYDEDDIAMAEYIKENTPADAVFLTSSDHLNPVASLAGRSIYVGSSLYVYFHGLGDEYYERESAMEEAYGGSYENLTEFCRENGIDYVYIGSNERNNSEIDINADITDRLELVHSEGEEAIYKVM
ncbi:MAG: hypothetical protein LUD03_06355 [Firmicutes bacterium]|nr:hypothetical protein [Bacillota bacterium]